MRIPDLESLIEDSEKTSPNYVDDEARQNLIDEAVWMDWAEKQLAEAQREQQKRQYDPSESIRTLDLVPGSSPLAGISWKIETSGSSSGSWVGNGSWVNTVPVTLTAPQAHTKTIMPKIGYHS